MMIRTSETTVTFRRPFAMPGLAEPQPAGTYKLVMDDLETGDDNLASADTPGSVFIVRKRLATQMLLPALSIFKTDKKSFDISASELALALDADNQTDACCLASESAVSS